MKQKVIAIVGPTAVGKTALSIELAKHLNGEIISGDSMQIYRNMDIGTAKIKKEETDGIKHHLIDIKNPDQAYSVADFQENVRACIDEIGSKNKVPILVGGSGLYVQAALYDFRFATVKRNEQQTEAIEKEIDEKGISYVYDRLKSIEPTQAEKINL